MAKYFIASVGSVEAFEKNSAGDYELAFVSKTLTDSGINTTITKDDIRGGTNAPIQFSFYHDPSVEITLTDVVFKQEYLEGQLGVEFAAGNGHSYASENLTSDANGKITLSEQPIGLNFGACGGEIYRVWASPVGEEEWKAYSFTEGSKDVTGFEADTAYCVRYCKADANALIAEVTSQIMPKEYMLIITAPIFSGDACSASNGKKAGSITYEIPRFRLNGGNEMAFNMSSNQTMSLSGMAYASDNSCDMDKQNLYNIVLSYDDGSSTLEDIIIDPEYLTVGEAPHIYAIYNGDAVLIDLDNSALEISDTIYNAETKLWSAAGTATVKFNGKEETAEVVAA